MSIMRCDYCQESTDTDFNEMFSAVDYTDDIDVNDVCEDCYHDIKEESECE